MNIFKILANGDGRINEANISAFLGYLLDPYQDHGLGFEFLERFLERIIENHLDDNFNLKSYEFDVLFEQAFRDEDKEIKKKEIVDIVILCFESNKGNYKELIAKSTITKTRELKYIFLFENKVTTGAKANQQLKAQFENTRKELNVDDSKVISLYITPDDKAYKDEFDKFGENTLKEHYVWKYKSLDKNNQKDILSILRSLISDESAGEIEAINEYTRHTIISFIKFVENDFKSQLIEKKEDAEKYKKDILENFDQYYEKYSTNLNDESNQILKTFSDWVKKEYPKLFIRHSKTHPITILQNPKSDKIFGCSKDGKNLEYHFVVRKNKNPEMVTELQNYLEEKGYKPKERAWAIVLREDFDIETLKGVFKDYLGILEQYYPK